VLYAGRQSVDRPSEAVYADYLESLSFLSGGCCSDYDVRLLPVIYAIGLLSAFVELLRNGQSCMRRVGSLTTQSYLWNTSCGNLEYGCGSANSLS